MFGTHTKKYALECNAWKFNLSSYEQSDMVKERSTEQEKIIGTNSSAIMLFLFLYFLQTGLLGSGIAKIPTGGRKLNIV